MYRYCCYCCMGVGCGVTFGAHFNADALGGGGAAPSLMASVAAVAD
jgi:hypothetical protein